MKKIILIGYLLGGSLLFANEPSVYGAGNIDSSSPYGLTSTEQNVLNNRKQVQRLTNQVSEQQNRIAGLTTVVDGLTRQVLDLKEQLKEIRKTANTREEDYKKSYKLLLDLGKMIDQINDSYVTKEDLEILRKESLAVPQPQSYDSQQYEQQQPIDNNSQNGNGMIIDGRQYNNGNGSTSTDISDIYREAVQLFSHKSYMASSEKFKQAIAQNYKIAPSNYYLGEIAYYTSDYYSAISYYKKSASTYDKASYMKVLYLHTALSLVKTNQDDKARGFFKYIVDNYPGTKSAEIAQKNLSNQTY